MEQGGPSPGTESAWDWGPLRRSPYADIGHQHTSLGGRDEVSAHRGVRHDHTVRPDGDPIARRRRTPMEIAAAMVKRANVAEPGSGT